MQQILDQMVVAKLDVRIWGGRKKLRKEDLHLADGSVLPPEDLASLGSKKITDPRELAEFHRLKKEGERTCLKVGTRFLGGFAIPKAAADSVKDELDRIGSSFESAKKAFLDRYDEAVESWVVKHPEFDAAIRKAVDPVEVVAAALSFDYTLFRVVSADDDSLDRKAVGLSDGLFREIAQDAQDFLERSLMGRAILTRKALNPLRRIRAKLEGLSFLDHRVQPIVDMLDDGLSRIPLQGGLQSWHMGWLVAVMALLSDPEKIKQYGDGLLGSWDPWKATAAVDPDDPPAAQESDNLFADPADTDVEAEEADCLWF
jgi:hypothetical protein